MNTEQHLASMNSLSNNPSPQVMWDYWGALITVSGSTDVKTVGYWSCRQFCDHYISSNLNWYWESVVRRSLGKNFPQSNTVISFNHKMCWWETIVTLKHLLSFLVFVFKWGCPKWTPHSGWFQQQKLISPFQRLGVQDQGACMVRFW